MIRALELRPDFGVGWYQLAELYESTGQFDLAIDAFIESGRFLNVGSDYLVRVGRIYEYLGDFQLAIRFYRQSIFQGAHERAAYLESQFLE